MSSVRPTVTVSVVYWTELTIRRFDNLSRCPRRAVGHNSAFCGQFFFEKLHNYFIRVMKISEIVKTEEGDKDIVLDKEGLFWRAYEHSAFLFVNNIKEYT